MHTPSLSLCELRLQDLGLEFVRLWYRGLESVILMPVNFVFYPLLTTKGSRQKKNVLFTVSLTVRVDPPPLTVSKILKKSRPLIMNVYGLKRILAKKKLPFLTILGWA